MSSRSPALEPSRALYSVVICGPVGREPDASAVLTGVFEANRLSRELAKIEPSSASMRGSNARGQPSTFARSTRSAAMQWQERATIAEREQEAWEERALLNARSTS